MNFKFHQNTRIIYIASVISLLVIIFVSSTFSIYADEVRKVDGDQPYDLMYLMGEKEDEINKLIENSNLEITDEKEVEFLYFPTAIVINNEEFNNSNRVIISEESYNSLDSNKLNLNKGELINLALDNLPIKQENNIYNYIKIKNIKEDLRLEYKNEIRKCIINTDIVSEKFVYVIDDDTYKILKESSKEDDSGVFRLINFDNWKESESLIEEINKLVLKEKKFNFENNSISKITYSEEIRQVNLSRLFIVGFMGVIFIIAIGGILYFKIMTEINDEIKKVKALKRIGTTNKQIKSLFKVQQGIIFFTPVIIGIVFGGIFIRIISKVSIMEKELIEAVMLISLLYIIVTSIFYIMCNRIYKNILILDRS